jgi:hypothetical protein
MILPLRQRHYHVFAVLGVLLPIAFVIGIAARKPIPHRPVPSLLAALRDSQTEMWNRRDFFPKIPVSARLLRGARGSFYMVEFHPGSGFAKPDLLVYWVAGNPVIADKLPDNARLLGAFGASLPLQLPSDAISAGGVLVLYSLADNEIVDTSKPTRFNDSTN